MATSEPSLDSMIKAIAWEDAKGKLRAVAAAQGSYHTRNSRRFDDEGPQAETYRKASAAVEAFIKDFEDHGLHE